MSEIEARVDAMEYRGDLCYSCMHYRKINPSEASMLDHNGDGWRCKTWLKIFNKPYGWPDPIWNFLTGLDKVCTCYVEES